MSKIVIIGAPKSGKTCYFYAMMEKMMCEVGGFSVLPDKKDLVEIQRGIKRLNDISIIWNSRIGTTACVHTYKLDLVYEGSSFEKIEFVDYPFEKIRSSEKEYVNCIKNTDVLFLCIDGESIKGDINDLDNLAKNLWYNWDCGSLNNALAWVAEKNEYLPPICLMITKYDKLDSEFHDREVLSKLLQKVFPVLFSGVVTICPVTLGKDFDKGARMNPQNVELPICSAAYLIEKSKMILLEKQLQQMFDEKLASGKHDPETEQQIELLRKCGERQQKIVDDLCRTINGLPLYIDGESVDW